MNTPWTKGARPTTRSPPKPYTPPALRGLDLYRAWREWSQSFHRGRPT